MSPIRGLVLVLAAGMVPAFPVWAQVAESGPPAAVLRGVVYDSLSGGPVSGADVILPGTAATARTDALGRFELRAPPGRYRPEFSHRRLSSWRALRHEAEVLLQVGGEHDVELGTASPGTVLARTCGGTGWLVGGQVRDMLTLMPLLGASVDVQPEASGVRTVASGLDGEYFACLDEAGAVEVRARMADARSRPMSGEAGPSRVLVQDLYLRMTEPAQITGHVRDGESGQPLSGAVVAVMGTRLRTVTSDAGTFSFKGVPPGHLQVSVERLGYGRGIAGSTVEGGGQIDLTLSLFPEAIAVDSLVVTVAGRTPDVMRTGQRFDGMTRPQIEALLPRSVSFLDMLRKSNIPGLKLRDTYFLTDNGARMFGVCIETSRTATIYSDQCEMVDVYLNDVRLSDPSTVLLTLSPEIIHEIQVLTRTEATFRYGGSPRSRNGILIIRTEGR